MTGENVLWKQRFESLVCDLKDIELTVRKQDLEVAKNRAWDASPEVFVSFQFDVVCDEERAIELWGEGNYDCYKLTRTGRDPYEQGKRP